MKQCFEASQVVTDKNTAIALGSGDLAVYSTPSMAALMEHAAMECAKPLLNEGETTVGCELNIKHLAATSVGQEVKATAELKHRDGRQFCFAVTAFVGEQKIGEGEHVRVAVNVEKFMSKLR